MAEIGMFQDAWELKLQLCWWHMKDCLCKRLKGKLSTTPYNAERAHAEFPFINKSFRPAGRADANEHEGSAQDKAGIMDITPKDRQNAISVRIPIPMSLRLNQKAPDSMHDRAPLTEELNTHIDAPPSTLAIPSLLPHIRLLPPKKSDENKSIKGPVSSEPMVDDTEEARKRTFCPVEFRDPIIKLVESHLCAHPLIPGYSAPTPAGIREWAVKQMYEFCHKHELPEVWAYLWENWYRPGRWEIWARSCNPCIPVLRTTMMLESQ